MSARSAKLLALTRVDALADRHSGALAGANIAARVTREEWARGAIEELCAKVGDGLTG